MGIVQENNQELRGLLFQPVPIPFYLFLFDPVDNFAIFFYYILAHLIPIHNAHFVLYIVFT
jgi:hypothetical protein